ncbi:MAG TPA: oligosaccharide flippase family protein [Candidatus Eisenbacteria bacterium]|jgi:O-antigen/teichoic acid export membrane protein|nr:oligosaccharide flippase family protein [Candidatus Eisenbacteria bacterium]
MSTSRFTLWWDRSLRFAMGSGSIFSGSLFGIIRNKWLATHLHAAGLGVLAQTSSAQAWLGSLANMGVGFPVAHAVGAARGLGNDDDARRTIWTALSITSLGSLFVAALGLTFAGPISRALLGSTEHALLVRVAALGATGIAFQGVLFGLFAGRSDLRANLTLSLVGGIVAVAATLALVPRWGLAGGAVGLAVLAPAGIAGVLLLHRRSYARLLTPVPKPPLDLALARSILGVGAAALVLTLVDLGTMLAVRSNYLSVNGVAANGLLQAALALSQQVGTLFYAYLSNYAFGKVSGLGGAAEIRVYTRRHWRPLMLLAAPIFALAMVASAPLLHLLYSSRFDPARPLMAWTLWGEFCRVGMNAWAVGALPTGGARLWLPIGIAPAIGLALSYAVLSHANLGTLSLPLAYAGAGLFSLCFGGIAMSRAGVTLTKQDLAVVLGSALALAALARWVSA